MTISSFERNASIAEMAVEIDRRGAVIESLEARLAHIDGIYRGAIDNLNHHQTQLDMDGVMVGVSRQALSEVLAGVEAALSATLPPTAPPAQSTAWHDMVQAPKDGTMLRLLVQPGLAEDDGWTPFADSSEPYVTVGFNALSDTGEDEWQFAGWDWSHDCFTDGAGTVIGWQPFDALTAPPARGQVEVKALMDFICDDVLPSYGIASEVGRSDPELFSACSALTSPAEPAPATGGSVE